MNYVVCLDSTSSSSDSGKMGHRSIFGISPSCEHFKVFFGSLRVSCLWIIVFVNSRTHTTTMRAKWAVGRSAQLCKGLMFFCVPSFEVFALKGDLFGVKIRLQMD